MPFASPGATCLELPAAVRALLQEYLACTQSQKYSEMGLQVQLRPANCTSRHGCNTRATGEPDVNGPKRRAVLGSIAAAPLAGVGFHPLRASASSSTSRNGDLPIVPTAQLGPNLTVSRIVKGCWQLSGGHKACAGLGSRVLILASPMRCHLPTVPDAFRG